MTGVHVNDRKKRGRGRRGGTSPRNRLPENAEALRPQGSDARLFFSGEWRCLVWVPDAPPSRRGRLRILFITAQKSGRVAASAHERDDPGNNMRTLSLSRRLGVDLPRGGLEVRGSCAPLKGVWRLL